ncbi:MAG: 4-hydroxy-3-methylbut-2-enyl diphosphate reductase [Acidimicrobiia bacterium]|nr:MAG: 4-hydroxy-3-methylbut-2-enyl diphosphate reductase [Acidimicrobiia bacterium]
MLSFRLPLFSMVMPKTVVLAEPRGFCAGVEMAIKALTWMVQVFEPPVYCYHEIVHNAAVVAGFERAGVVFVDDVTDVPPGRPIMLSAHGSAPDVVAAADDRAAVLIDAVCPLVTKVHHEMRRMSTEGFDIIYIGHQGHDEAIGSLAEAPDAAHLIDPRVGLASFTPADENKVALLAQTTLGFYEWEGVLDEARRRFPSVKTARKSDLCYATTNRQEAIESIAEVAPVILVVGSENSSNTQALVRVARNAGAQAHRIDGPGDIDPSWFEGIDVVGVSAGASAPDQQVQAVIDAIAPTEGVERLRVTDEDEYFPLPPRLRSFVATLQSLIEGGFAARTIGEPGPIDEDRDWGATEALELIAL